MSFYDPEWFVINYSSATAADEEYRVSDKNQ
jgi:hypothetical protein